MQRLLQMAPTLPGHDQPNVVRVGIVFYSQLLAVFFARIKSPAHSVDLLNRESRSTVLLATQVSSASLVDAVINVLFGSPCRKVIGIYAARVVARMKHLKPVRYWAFAKLKDQSVNHFCHTALPDLPIAGTVQRSIPIPTVTRLFVHPQPESLPKSFLHFLRTGACSFAAYFKPSHPGIVWLFNAQSTQQK